MTLPSSTIPVAARRRRRVLGWFGGDHAEASAEGTPAAAVAAERRITLRRRLFDDIGTLVFAHGLTPSPRAYGVLHAYVSGEDPRTGAAVADRLRDPAGLSDAVVARIAEDNDALQTGALGQIAEALEARIADCLTAAGESRGTAETFGTALHEEAGRLRSDPHATLERIIALTERAVEATRLVETKLQRARAEADRLRHDLQDARRAAEHDHLTGLPNRRSFEARLRNVLAEPGPRHAAVALIDIDDFKQVNDRFGHPAGDRVLKFVAGFLRAQLRRKVLVARYGGEEFALLFEDMSLDDAAAALDDARERLSRRSLVHQDSGEAIGRVTFSAGIVVVGGGDDVLRAADLALYAAKNAGKNRVMRGGNQIG
ncbi:sensor domain-containing diguanylate cyclase [Sphingomonas phyllosphaerae]|uniref:GGDEF domain-containing protein n=1 Tax=Sphingomonas phyllosphaerae TaxID=257003 RepID=UPI0004022D05|nr:GGDEF domain-containing protein [Sphingomonas phyllosphaerae]